MTLKLRSSSDLSSAENALFSNRMVGSGVNVLLFSGNGHNHGPSPVAE